MYWEPKTKFINGRLNNFGGVQKGSTAKEAKGDPLGPNNPQGGARQNGKQKGTGNCGHLTLKGGVEGVRV